MQELDLPVVPPDHDAALNLIRRPHSPTLTVLRDMTAQREQFTLRHEPMNCPVNPDPPKQVRAGKRAHVIYTLTDLVRYVRDLRGTETRRPVGFYDNDSVAVVLDDDSAVDREVITCSMMRHPSSQAWIGAVNKPMNQEAFVNFLRLNGSALAEEYRDGLLVGQFSSLHGTLIHGADEYLDLQKQSAIFTVRRKVKGKDDDLEAEVPTAFWIAVRILPDDPTLTDLQVMVRMTGLAGAQISFQMMIPNLESIVNDHIDERLKSFAAAAGFLCVRGRYQEAPWAEPHLPLSIKSLMELQTQQLAAMNSRPDS